MDTTVRNLDETLYRRVKARAGLERRTVGDLLNDAMRLWLSAGVSKKSRKLVSLMDLRPQAYPAGNEHLSENIDVTLYY